MEGVNQWDLVSWYQLGASLTVSLSNRGVGGESVFRDPDDTLGDSPVTLGFRTSSVTMGQKSGSGKKERERKEINS